MLRLDLLFILFIQQTRQFPNTHGLLRILIKSKMLTTNVMVVMDIRVRHQDT
jgi:hypothetical protein